MGPLCAGIPDRYQWIDLETGIKRRACHRFDTFTPENYLPRLFRNKTKATGRMMIPRLLNIPVPFRDFDPKVDASAEVATDQGSTSGVDGSQSSSSPFPGISVIPGFTSEFESSQSSPVHSSAMYPSPSASRGSPAHIPSEHRSFIVHSSPVDDRPKGATHDRLMGPVDDRLMEPL